MLVAPLPVEFFARDTVDVARDLIGCVLCRQVGRALLAGTIVETEAYLPVRDPASHGYRGKTRKNASMFGPPGMSYVYPIHAKWCFNVVTEAEGLASAVLIRSIEPLKGIAQMRRHRGLHDNQGIVASGPARLCQALRIDRSFDGWDLTAGKALWLQHHDGPPTRLNITRTRRIGVTAAKHRKLRFISQKDRHG